MTVTTEKWSYYSHMTIVWRNCHFSVVPLTSSVDYGGTDSNVDNLTVMISLYYGHMTANYGHNQFKNIGPATNKDKRERTYFMYEDKQQRTCFTNTNIRK